MVDISLNLGTIFGFRPCRWDSSTKVSFPVAHKAFVRDTITVT